MNRPLIENLETRRLFVVDLICFSISNLNFDADTALLKMNVQVTNSGTTPIPANTLNKVFLSTDTQVNNSDDITIGSIASALIPSTGTLATLPIEIDLTGQPAGAWFVGVALDSNGAVNEPDDSNNYRFSTSKVTIGQTFDVNIVGTGGKDSIIASQVGDVVSFSVNGVITKTLKTDRIASIVLSGLGGNDTINASTLTLPVYIAGGADKDRIIGGIANDTLSGNGGPDTISGGGGSDRLNGNGGNDLLYGESAADRLYGNEGNDLLDGGSSNDRLDGGPGIDTLYGQGGNDRFYSQDAMFDQLFGGSGTDNAQLDIIDRRESVEVTGE